MDEKNTENKSKRVSFAPEPKVMYIYPGMDDLNDKAMESEVMSEDEVTMELTVDHLKISGSKQLDLEDGSVSDGNFLDLELNKLVGREDPGSVGEHDLGRQKGAEGHDCTQIEVPGLCVATGGQIDSYGDENMRNDEGNAKRRNRFIDSPRKRSRESVARRSIGGELDTTVIGNETINVEEIINTQDLRKMIPQVRRDIVNVSELLVSKGIRFLDNLVVSNTRRDTMSKSKNKVSPGKVQFYESFLEPRTNFFLDFSEDIEERMKKQEKVNMDLENSFNVAGTIFEKEDVVNQLRALKAECRMRAKIDWYELRKQKELEFNQLILNRKNDLVYEHNTLMSNLEDIEGRLRERQVSNSKKEEQISRMRNRIGEGHGHMGSDVDKLKSIEKLREKANEQERVSEDVKKELDRLTNEKNMKEAERDGLNESLEGVMSDIRELERTLKTRSVTEIQLKEMRQDFRTLCSVLDWEILKIDVGQIRFRLLGYEFIVGFDLGFVITSVNVEIAKDSVDYELYAHGKKHFGGVGLSIPRGIQEIAVLASTISGIQKELGMIKKDHEVDCYTKDGCVIVKVVITDVMKCIKKDVMVVIGNGFECSVENGNDATYSLTDKFGVITKLVEDAYLSL